jgi:hypothetical protein
MFVYITEMTFLRLFIWLSVQQNNLAYTILEAKMLKIYLCFIEDMNIKILMLLH